MEKFLQSKGFVIILTIVFILVFVALSRESYRYFKVNQEIKDLEQKIEELKERNEELSKMENYFQSKDFIEREARVKLNLTKPGEKLIIIKKAENVQEQESGGEEGVEKTINIQKWWNYFFE